MLSAGGRRKVEHRLSAAGSGGRSSPARTPGSASAPARRLAPAVASVSASMSGSTSAGVMPRPGLSAPPARSLAKASWYFGSMVHRSRKRFMCERDVADVVTGASDRSPSSTALTASSFWQSLLGWPVWAGKRSGEDEMAPTATASASAAAVVVVATASASTPATATAACATASTWASATVKVLVTWLVFDTTDVAAAAADAAAACAAPAWANAPPNTQPPSRPPTPRTPPRRSAPRPRR